MLNNQNHKVCFETMDDFLGFNCNTDFTLVIILYMNGLHSKYENSKLWYSKLLNLLWF